MSNTDDGSGGGRRPGAPNDKQALLDFFNKPKPKPRPINFRPKQAPSAVTNITDLKTEIHAWARAGCKCKTRSVTFRPQDTYPNTFCIIYQNVTFGGRRFGYVCLDVHYYSDGAMQALGGLWITGLDGSLKPNNDQDLKEAFLPNVPTAAPSDKSIKYSDIML
jgi:hypothetical protein